MESLRIYIIGILVTAFILCPDPAWLADGRASLLTRSLTYHFFHANVFHLAANCLSCWYIFNPKRKAGNLRDLAMGFMIASITCSFSIRPVIGISNILFAIFGMRTPQFSHPWWHHRSVLIFYAITFGMLLLPQFAGLTHIISMGLGILVAVCRRAINNMDYDLRRATGK